MRIFVAGAKPAFDVDASTSLEDRFQKTGHNTGNQIIAYGVLNTIEHSFADWDPEKSPEYINENFDVVVIAAANFLYKSFDFGYLADFIERISLPVSIVGLGAQSSDFANDVELLPGTERLLAVLADRCALIGVRGEYTAEVLARRQINNVQITGCPSYYSNPTRILPKKLPVLPVSARIAVNASRDVVGHAFDRDKMIAVVQNILALAVESDATFVAQTEHEEMLLAEGGLEGPYSVAEEMYRRCFRPIEDKAKFIKWAKSRNRVFWRVSDWIAAMGEMDFSFGTRFHGNIAAMLAGVPPLVICHDTRTAEMCKFLAMPNVDLDKAKSASLQDLYEYVDLSALYRRRAKLIPEFSSFLRANGLVPKSHLL